MSYTDDINEIISKFLWNSVWNWKLTILMWYIKSLSAITIQKVFTCSNSGTIKILEQLLNLNRFYLAFPFF